MNGFRSKFFLATCVWLIASGLAHAQLPVGSASEDTALSLFDDGDELVPASLKQFEGKIILLFYYTPW